LICTAASPVLIQAVEQRFIISLVGRRLIKHDDVQTFKLFLILTEGFANQSLYSVSANGQLAVLFGYGKAQSCCWAVVPAVQYREQLVFASPGFFKYTTI
jgi:hypothetical protein